MICAALLFVAPLCASASEPAAELPEPNAFGPAPPPPAALEPGVTPVVPIAFGAATVSLVTGVITGAIALSQLSELEDVCSSHRCRSPQERLLATHQALVTASEVAFSIAAVGASVGAIAWIIDASSSSPSSTATLGFRWTLTGLALDGSWQ